MVVINQKTFIKRTIRLLENKAVLQINIDLKPRERAIAWRGVRNRTLKTSLIKPFASGLVSRKGNPTSGCQGSWNMHYSPLVSRPPLMNFPCPRLPVEQSDEMCCVCVRSTISKVIKLARRRQRSLGSAFVCPFWKWKNVAGGVWGIRRESWSQRSEVGHLVFQAI